MRAITKCTLVSIFLVGALPEAVALPNVHLRSSNGQYVVAEGGGGGIVNANRTLANVWETFQLHDLDGGTLSSGHHVTFKTYDNHYLQAENGGNARMLAAGQGEGSYETFIIERVAGPGVIRSGDQVTLRVGNWYASAEQGGGSVVNVNRSSAGPWERFTFVQGLGGHLQNFTYWQGSVSAGDSIEPQRNHANLHGLGWNTFPRDMVGAFPAVRAAGMKLIFPVPTDFSQTDVIRAIHDNWDLIYAFFTEDEPDCAWPDQAMLDALARIESKVARARQEFPDAKFMVTLGCGSWPRPGFHIPAGIDFIALESYGSTGDPARTRTEWLEKLSHLRDFTNPSQRIFLMPAATLGYGTEDQLIQKGNDIFDYAQTDQTIIGMAPFDWFGGDHGELGVRDLPRLRARYVQIGQAITGRTNGSTLTVNLAGPGAGLSSVTSTPSGLTCVGTRCIATFSLGTQVTLQANPGPNSYFIRFSGDAPCSSGSLLMNQNYTCDANFGVTTSTLIRQMDLPGFGSGGDGSAVASTVSNLNTQTLVSRAYADGIAYQVSSDPTGQTTITTAVFADGVAAGDLILLIDLQGSPISSVGYYDLLSVVDVLENAISVSTAPRHSYTGGGFSAQKVVVQRIPQYSDLTIVSGGLVTAGAWDGLAPQPGGWVNTGIVAVAVQGTLTINLGGAIDVSALGYRGAPSVTGVGLNGSQGEGLCGTGTVSTAENCGGGGGGTTSFSSSWYGAEGGGGGHASPGESGSRDIRDPNPVTTPGSGGARYGQTDLSDQLFFGAGGGAGGNYSNGNNEPTAPGGAGGGVVFILSGSLNNQGTIQADGHDGFWANDALSGGAGAGGSILIEAFDAALGSNLVRAHAGSTLISNIAPTRYSSVGTISVFYSNSVSGSAY